MLEQPSLLNKNISNSLKSYRKSDRNYHINEYNAGERHYYIKRADQHRMYSKEQTLTVLERHCTLNKKGFVFAHLLVTPEPGYR